MPIRTTPLPQRPARFGSDERSAIDEVLSKNELWYLQENSVVELAAKEAAARFGSRFAVATSSGTASLHVAVAASGMRPGSEVITSPVTDIGTINAILYQNLIPIFADIDPDSAHLTPETVKAQITERTRAVVAVHLAGCPLEIVQLAELCKSHNLILIEDCAQALDATFKGQYVGTFGDFGCYSLNDQKHITSGEGGFVLVNDEERFYLCHNYADKYYDRHKRGVRLNALAPNYRMSELDGAMFRAQLPKLAGIVNQRRRLGDRLNKELGRIRGIIPQRQPAAANASYFFYLLRIDPAVIQVKRDVFIELLRSEGIPATGAYVPTPIYKSPYFVNKSFFPGGVWPAEIVSGQSYDYRSVSLPGAELAVDTGICLKLHEGFTNADIDDYIAAIGKVARENS